MKWSTLVLSLLPLVSAAPKKGQQPTFGENVIYTPPDNYTDPRVLYARTAQLKDGTLLATWENYSPEPPMVYFPIYRSKDGGVTWKELSRVEDTANGLGLRYQPFLYVLEKSFAGFPKDTVLLAGSSIPTDLSSTQIDLYASTNKGRSWKFVSHIAGGGEARPNHGLTPVWEPFLMQYKDTIICYYSDQRDNATHSQKMVHQTTTNLRSWGPVVDDVKYPVYWERPGMPTVAKLPNGKYIMTYEYGGSPVLSGYQFPVFFKVVSDPEAFGAAEGAVLRTTDGYVPTGSPYVVWSPVGGANGTIIASAHSSGDVYVNTGLAEPGTPWRRVATPQPNAYTRHLRVLSNDPSKLLIMGAGQLPPSTTNKVSLSVMDISKL
ncbi:glycoside hydrolase family 93 protein [Parathielavia hyrcaniae]|uniref:Glycoside hydrolase family 93 protein n=1 Tax=Parathielavia hyrcaniae TaxID=113614 RepID=A0AAN6Q6E6_9PEZI|nr:glycoside hydrolase family 93 protein [Parathielavia hyrcaniae]